MNHRIENKLTHLGLLFPRALIMASLVLLPFVCGCQKPEVKIDTEYKAVFLDNGQVFFGKLEKEGSSYILLKDVFYVQSQVVQQEKDKKEVRSILIKRGNEWHGPDLMYIARHHIVVIEPVSPNSRVGKLISEAKGQK